jgi:hypothetical protein
LSLVVALGAAWWPGILSPDDHQQMLWSSAKRREEPMGRPSIRAWLLLLLAAAAGCGGAQDAAPPQATPATTSLPTPTTVLADTPAERALQLTRNLPQAYQKACQQFLASVPLGAAGCPPLVPEGPLEVRAAGPIAASDGYERSYVLELASDSLDTIHGRTVDTNGGHWTVSAARGPTARKVLAEQLHAALGTRPARCRQLRLAGEWVEACQVPATDDGYYSGHIAYAWEHRGVIYHITIHGHAEEPRVALMMAALIKLATGR